MRTSGPEGSPATGKGGLSPARTHGPSEGGYPPKGRRIFEARPTSRGCQEKGTRQTYQTFWLYHMIRCPEIRDEDRGPRLQHTAAEEGREVVHERDHQVDGEDEGEELVLQGQADGDLDLLAQPARAEAVPIRRRTTR